MAIIPLASESSAYFIIIRMSVMVPLTPPCEILCFSMILFDRFRRSIQNSSLGMSASSGWKSSITSELDEICFLLTGSATALRLPNSSAEAMVMARACPIPFTLHKSFIDWRPSSDRLLLQEWSIRLATSTADSFLVPDPISMANISASPRAPIPLVSIFSRGLSSTDHSFMLSFFE